MQENMWTLMKISNHENFYFKQISKIFLKVLRQFRLTTRLDYTT